MAYGDCQTMHFNGDLRELTERYRDGATAVPAVTESRVACCPPQLVARRLLLRRKGKHSVSDLNGRDSGSRS